MASRMVRIPKGLTIERLERIRQIMKEVDPEEGDWCGSVSEKIREEFAEFELYCGAPFAEPRPFGGCRVDDTHTYNVLPDGTIVDSTVMQFVGPPGTPAGWQKRAAKGWPYVEGFPEIAVIPLGHPYLRKMGYESHRTGYGWVRKPSWWKRRGNMTQKNLVLKALRRVSAAEPASVQQITEAVVKSGLRTENTRGVKHRVRTILQVLKKEALITHVGPDQWSVPSRTPRSRNA